MLFAILYKHIQDTIEGAFFMFPFYRTPADSPIDRFPIPPFIDSHVTSQFQLAKTSNRASRHACQMSKRHEPERISGFCHMA